MVTPQDKSLKKMKFVSSAETKPASTTTISEDSKSGRGISTMPHVVKRKYQKIKPVVEVPLMDKKWAEIPNDIKEQIWEAVDMAFVSDQLEETMPEVEIDRSTLWKKARQDKHGAGISPRQYFNLPRQQRIKFADQLKESVRLVLQEETLKMEARSREMTLKMEARTKQLNIEVVDYSKLEVPSSLQSLCRYVETTLKPHEKIMTFTIEKEVFGDDHSTFVLPEDITQLAGMEEIGATVVAVYMRCLFDNLKAANMFNMVGFIDPAQVSANARSLTERSRLVANRLQKTDGEQIFMMPYNPGRHWVLLIVRAKKETVYFLDPLPGNRAVDEEAKNMLNSAIKMYNSHIGRQGRKATIWKTLSGTPKQPSSVGCGYYVMRFMRDIIMDPSLEFEKTFAKGKDQAPYPQAAIDEVRKEWAEFVCLHME
ncbi:unnamed protein product [Prunus armeniaca]